MSCLNRREFTVRSLAASSALVTTAFATRSSLGTEAKRSRVAIIGHTGRGDYGHGLDLMWRRVPDSEVVAVADANAAGLAEAQKRLSLAKGYSDYTSMLSEVRPDVVAVAPRHVDQHHAMCLAAIAAGARGIYVEKPFCRTPREADEIIAECERKNVKLAVAHRNRYHPVLAVVEHLIAQGEIGALLEIRARGKEDRRGGPQDLWVLGSHLMNLATFFAGSPVACSGMFYQDGRPCHDKEIRQGDEGIGPVVGNETHARFEMKGGTVLFFDSIQNRGDKAAGFGLQLVGSEGVIDLRVDREPLVHIRRGNPHNPLAPSVGWLPVTTAGIDQPEPISDVGTRIASHQAAGEDLIASIAQDRRPLCDAAEGRTTIEMICSIFESHVGGGKRVEIPLSRRDHPLSVGLG